MFWRYGQDLGVGETKGLCLQPRAGEVGHITHPSASPGPDKKWTEDKMKARFGIVDVLTGLKNAKLPQVGKNGKSPWWWWWWWWVPFWSSFSEHPFFAHQRQTAISWKRISAISG